MLGIIFWTTYLPSKRSMNSWDRPKQWLQDFHLLPQYINPLTLSLCLRQSYELFRTNWKHSHLILSSTCPQPAIQSIFSHPNQWLCQYLILMYLGVSRCRNSTPIFLLQSFPDNSNPRQRFTRGGKLRWWDIVAPFVYKVVATHWSLPLPFLLRSGET